jgi:hypothetical protein
VDARRRRKKALKIAIFACPLRRGRTVVHQLSDEGTKMADDKQAISTFSGENRHFEPSADFSSAARIKSKADYDKLYKESIESPATFWKRETADLVFKKPWTSMVEWDLPHAKWFVGAELNITESCLDRHLKTAVKDKTALVWESEPGESSTASRSTWAWCPRS